MNLFVLCGGDGKYSGRIIGQQLQQRLRGLAIVHRGDSKKLDKKLEEGIIYDFVLNMGLPERVVTRSRPLNNFHVVKHTINRKICRMKLRMKKLPTPFTITKLENITTRDLPMIGRSNFSSDKQDLWSCLDLADVRKSETEGATHWVEFIEEAREFKVHVVAPHTTLYLAKPKNFQVIKVSERLKRGKDKFNLFGDPIDCTDPIIKEIKALAQLTLGELQLHWAAVTILVDKKGDLKILKVDACPNLKEDQTNILKKYSYAICKMLGEKPQTLVLSRPTRE